MSSDVTAAELATIKAERDLYLRLLNLGGQEQIEPLLKEALALIVEIDNARQGYLEVRCDEDEGDEPRWWIAHGFSDSEIESVRAAISQGIISEALASGRTIMTPSAMLDPRFSGRESVRLGRIEAVLCAPIGQDPPRGVLYLQGRSASGLFSDEERSRVEVFADHLGSMVDRLLSSQEPQAPDPMAGLRAAMGLDGIIGRSRALASTLKQVALVAPLDVSVLLTGDSGTGKTQLARVIHSNGPRARHPFVELNCAALPETLIESELFGALPGAHSTATKRIEGKVAAAEGGALFLDEVGELSPGAQAKLLQLLQSKQYYPLGATTPEQADVRVIAATNTDLKAAVEERRFREDLYFRLQVLPIRVPSLAERREDIAELAEFLCAAACERHGLPRLGLSRGAIRAVESAEWPGNVRQLSNMVEAAAIRAAGEAAREVDRKHIFPDSPGQGGQPMAAPSFQEATRQYQAQFLSETLAATDWNIAETARRLDLARSHVYNLIRAFGLARDK